MPKNNGNGRAAPPPRARANPRRLAAAAEAEAEQEIADLQASTEGVALTGELEFMGETFRLSERVGLMPMLKFAHTAAKGVEADDMEGMAAMYAIIRAVVWKGEPPCGECEACAAAVKAAPDGALPDAVLDCPYFEAGDWARFETAAINNDAGGNELLEFVGDAMQQIAARPTSARSGSSSPARRASRKSKRTSQAGSVPGRIVPPGAEDMVPVADLLLP